MCRTYQGGGVCVTRLFAKRASRADSTQDDLVPFRETVLT